MVHAVSTTYLRFEHMSPPAAGMALLLHAAVALALYLVSPLKLSEGEAAPPIEVTIESPNQQAPTPPPTPAVPEPQKPAEAAAAQPLPPAPSSPPPSAPKAQPLLPNATEGRTASASHPATRSGPGANRAAAGAGGAAHLPGMIASITPLPVIGVPIKSSNSLEGWDSILSILQMPNGIPVATVALNAAKNAGILAASILGSFDTAIGEKVAAYKKQLGEDVLKKVGKLKSEGWENEFDTDKK